MRDERNRAVRLALRGSGWRENVINFKIAATAGWLLGSTRLGSERFAIHSYPGSRQQHFPSGLDLLKDEACG
ncbi:hypothetical protein CGCF415_v005827 [Colletotrichum fructicola]|uniref:Uncharacterized protein n=1 Tax=Colletotrichum fructicola (strain Nara gc5) TaxID=1213859 RepID=A0A7J6IMS2_COLFN|nr:hypothetical protein CGGC5_v014606 [Colletotrichum fructicola Nara gc5]KAF4881723.1 hypothetical protein CGCFRS4_v015274 [Colletotrichum fructicola]KAF4909642.1 hypothetical protein CGCF415_v005827 [Colletotrichum fructicola]KAF4922520.1 hypothetical protein CGCF245_v015302 [Colletotrichum fructicola]